VRRVLDKHYHPDPGAGYGPSWLTVQGIQDFHIHDLRHTCAAWAVQAGAPLLEVCHLLRHSDIRMTMRYAHLAPENVRAVVRKLEAGEPASVYDPATHESGEGNFL
jgi:integrase